MQRTAWWTAAAAILAFAAGNALAKAPNVGGNGAPNVGGNAGPGNSNAAPDHGNANRDNRGDAVEKGTTKLLDPARINRDVPNANSPGVQRRDERRGDQRFGDNGRYQWYLGRWWYWLPDNRWVYYDNGAWQDYNYNTSDQTQNYQTNDDRYEFYNGQWWYAMPGGLWVIWTDGRWNNYTGNDAPQRRISGYRGLPDEGRHEERAPNNPTGPNLNNPQPNIERNAPRPGNPGKGPSGPSGNSKK